MAYLLEFTTISEEKNNKILLEMFSKVEEKIIFFWCSKLHSSFLTALYWFLSNLNII